MKVGWPSSFANQHGVSRTERHVGRVCAGVVTTALLLAACGGDETGEAADSTSPELSNATGSTHDATSFNGTASSSQAAGASGTDTDDAAGPRCDATVPGAEITFGAYLSPGQLDPTLVAGGLVGGTEIAALYDVLFTYDYSTNEVEPHLAKGIEANDDFTEFTLTLRKGIAYGDGTPLDAQMVADNFDRYFADGATAPHAAFAAFIKEMEVVDPQTLRIRMKRPWAEFPAFLAEQMGMIVNTNVVGDDLQAFAADPPDAAGVGPYVLKRNAPGDEIVFEARDDYWGGPVCVETLRVVAIPGGAATYDAFRNDEIDVAYFRDPQTIAEAQADGEEGTFISIDVGAELLLNLADGHVASDPRVREAIWRAIDPDILNERVYQGKANMSMSLIHPESPWATDDLASVEYDPERARQLVEEAEADGVDVSLEILADPVPPASDSAITVQGMLQAAGIDATVSNSPINEIIGNVFEGNFDSAGWSLSIEPAQIASRLYGALHSGADNNQGEYANAEMDAALEKAMAAGTDERAEAVAAVNDIYVDDYVSPVFSNNVEGIIWQPDVEGVVVAPTNIYLFHDAVVAS